jgi:hypothetical protein
MTEAQAEVSRERGGVLLYVALGCIFAVIFWLGVMAIVTRNAVTVDTIAPVTFKTADVGEYQGPSQPISNIGIAAMETNPTRLTGWATDVRDLCAGDLGDSTKNSILLTQEGNGYVAVRTDLTPKACEAFKRQSRDRRVWAVTDKQLNPHSVQAYVYLNKEPDQRQ